MERRKGAVFVSRLVRLKFPFPSIAIHQSPNSHLFGRRGRGGLGDDDGFRGSDGGGRNSGSLANDLLRRHLLLNVGHFEYPQVQLESIRVGGGPIGAGKRWFRWCEGLLFPVGTPRQTPKNSPETPNKAREGTMRVSNQYDNIQ